MAETPKFMLCRVCDGWVGSCGGHRADCPMVWGHKSRAMRRIAWAYAVAMVLLCWALYRLWSNGTP